MTGKEEHRKYPLRTLKVHLGSDALSTTPTQQAPFWETNSELTKHICLIFSAQTKTTGKDNLLNKNRNNTKTRPHRPFPNI